MELIMLIAILHGYVGSEVGKLKCFPHRVLMLERLALKLIIYIVCCHFT